jgi:hypothetical protein
MRIKDELNGKRLPMAELTYREALIVAWFVFWRMTLWGGAIGLILSFTVAVALVPFGISFDQTMGYSQVPGILGTLCVTPLILKDLLRTQFRTFRVHVVRGEGNSATSDKVEAQVSS